MLGTQHIRIADDRRERRFQFVREARNEILALARRISERVHFILHRVCHGVEVLREFGNSSSPFTRMRTL